MYLPRGARTSLLVALTAVAAACGGDAIDAPASGSPLAPAGAPGGSGVGFDLVPIDGFAGAGSSPERHGCADTRYRQFDFWVGTWDVFLGASSTLAGTNEVNAVLGGCAVEEHWTASPSGRRGRSLNAFDISTGTWSQMWVSDGGCPQGDIFMEGGLVNGRMLLRGRRRQPAGFLIGPPCGAPPQQVVFSITDRYRWTPLKSGSVLQEPAIAFNGTPLPPLPPPSALAGLRYDPVAHVTPIVVPAPPPSFCPFRAAAAQFDFMLGEWRVRERQDGNAGIEGHARFVKDLSGCLVEEQFSGPSQYEGRSYNTFDVFTQRWVRTFVDNGGRRLFLTGGLDGTAMVLTGTRVVHGGRAVTIRVSWVPETADRVVQRWEYSRDGGTTWKIGKAIVYSRQ